MKKEASGERGARAAKGRKSAIEGDEVGQYESYMRRARPSDSKPSSLSSPGKPASPTMIRGPASGRGEFGPAIKPGQTNDQTSHLHSYSSCPVPMLLIRAAGIRSKKGVTFTVCTTLTEGRAARACVSLVGRDKEGWRPREPDRSQVLVLKLSERTGMRTSGASGSWNGRNRRMGDVMGDGDRVRPYSSRGTGEQGSRGAFLFCCRCLLPYRSIGTPPWVGAGGTDKL